MQTRYKYPRTPHLPWSPGRGSDDKVLADTSCFEGKRVIITEKMDGENTTLYNDGLHARSIDSKHHPSRSWIKSFWASNVQDILHPEVRICGENMFAKHSIKYHALDSYFLGFSVWKNSHCMSWDTTLMVFELYNIKPVPVLYDGLWDENYRWLGYRTCGTDDDKPRLSEGYVVRIADGFELEDFGKSVCKYVRTNHVQTDQHWMQKEVEVNGLA